MAPRARLVENVPALPWLCVLLVLVSLVGSVSAGAQARDWPSERPPRPLPARDSKFPPYQIQTLPNGLQVMAILHHEQPAVSMRLLIRTGTRLGSEGQAGAGARAGVAARPGHGIEIRRRAQRRDRFDRRIDGRGRLDRPDVPEHGGHEGQLRAWSAHAVRHGAPSGVLAGRDRPPAAADAVGSARQPRRPGLRGRRGVRSSRLRLSPVRDASHGNAGIDCRDHARRPRGVSPEVLRPQQRHSRHRRRRDGGRSVRRSQEGVRRLGTEGCADREVHRSAGAHAAADRGQQARRGPDRSTRRTHRDPAQASRLHGSQPGDPDPRRRGQQSPAQYPAHATGAHLRRPGQHGRAEGERRLRRADQHALRRDRRGAAPHVRRVLAAAARSGQRA